MNVLETIVMMLVTMLVFMTMFAHAMMLMTMAAFITETVVPILAKLFKKGQQLLLFVIGEASKQIVICMLGAACLCLCFSGLSQRNVHSPTIFAVALTGDQSCNFQLFNDLAGGTGLNTQLLGQFALGHTLRLVQDLEDAVLAALTVETAMSHAAQSAQQCKELFVNAHFAIVRVLLFFMVMITVSFFGDDSGAQIFLATTAAGIAQIAAFRAAGTDVGFMFTHIL